MKESRRRNGRQARSGITLIELLVVSTILVLIASLTLPVSQIIRQRDKESRLREILRQVRDQGIGLGTQSGGYANYISYYLNTAVDPALPTEASRSYAISSGIQLGLSYPRTPTLLENPIGQVLKIPTDGGTGSVTVTIPRRFIRKIPPHPFADWYPGVKWEFKIIASDPGAGLGAQLWFASAAGDPWNTGKASGVIDIRSSGAGIGLDGTNTDEW